MHWFIAVNHLAPDRYQGSFQNPFWHINFLEKRCWLWAAAILQREKKKMKSEGDECQPPRSHWDVYAWVVQPAGLLLREIKNLYSFGLCHNWCNKKRIDSGPRDLGSSSLSSMLSVTLGQSLPVSKVPHPIWNEGIRSSLASSWEVPYLLLRISVCLLLLTSSHCIRFQIQC